LTALNPAFCWHGGWRYWSGKLMDIIKAFVHEYVVPRAKNNKAIIIATRHSEMWQLPKHRDIVVYNSVESRAAYLNLKSKGGKKIIEHLGL